MIYADASALLKLLVNESESEAFVYWLQANPDQTIVSSEIVSIEVLRACRRSTTPITNDAIELLATIDLIPLNASIRDRAATIGDPHLRALDAIHLASALEVADGLEAFACYDRRLSSAAEIMNLVVVAPSP